MQDTYKEKILLYINSNDVTPGELIVKNELKNELVSKFFNFILLGNGIFFNSFLNLKAAPINMIVFLSQFIFFNKLIILIDNFFGSEPPNEIPR